MSDWPKRMTALSDDEQALWALRDPHRYARQVLAERRAVACMQRLSEPVSAPDAPLVAPASPEAPSGAQRSSWGGLRARLLRRLRAFRS